MADETKNLKLFKYNTRTDRKEKFSIDDALNDNWDKVDEAVNANKESIAEVKEEVAGIISPPPIEFESGKFLSNDGNKLVWKEVEAGASEEELALKEDKANKGVPGGYAGLNARGKVFGSQLDLSSKQDVLVPGEGIKIVGNTISSTVKAGASEEELALKEDKANKGVPGGYAGLDAEGKVPTAQLPNTSSGLELCDTDIVIRDDEKMFEQLQQMRRSTFDKSKFTVVGSPTITDDGIASGFSGRNYITTPIPTELVGNPKKWTMTTKFHFDYVPGTSSAQCIFCNEKQNSSTGLLSYVINDANSNKSSVRIILFNSSNATIINFETAYASNVMHKDTTYFVKAEYDNLHFVYSISEDGKNWTNLYNDNISEAPYFENGCNITIGTRARVLSSYILNSIDLKQFSITVDGKEVFSGNKTGIDTIKPDNYEVVGSPVISEDGVASGFTASDYLTIPKEIINSLIGHKWKIEYEFITKPNADNNTSHRYLLGTKFDTNTTNPINLGLFNMNYFWFASLLLSDGSRTNPFYNTLNNSNSGSMVGYLEFDGNNYTNAVLQETDTSWLIKQVASNLSIAEATEDLKIGYRLTSGSIDLNSFKIYIDGNLVYQPCLKIPYTQSKTGSKIVDEVYRDRVIDLYEQEGQAGYYTIDEPNKNFTLPMGEIYGMIGQRRLISSTVTETNRVDIYSDKTCLVCGNVATAGTINLPIELVNNNYFVTLSTSAKTATSFTTTATGDYILIGKVI